MNVAVWDTYVERKDGKGIMHFDILVPEELKDTTQIKAYGLGYLKDKPFETEGLFMDRCLFCHVEKVPLHLEKEIEHFGFVVVELSNCD